MLLEIAAEGSTIEAQSVRTASYIEVTHQEEKKWVKERQNVKDSEDAKRWEYGWLQVMDGKKSIHTVIVRQGRLPSDLPGIA